MTGARIEVAAGVAAALALGLPMALLAAPVLPVESPLGSHRYLNVMLALGVVLVTVVAAGWFFRRTLRVPSRGQGELRVVGGLSLGARERLVLVQSGSRRILLAVSPGRIHSLDVEIGDRPFEVALAERVAVGPAGAVRDAG